MDNLCLWAIECTSLPPDHCYDENVLHQAYGILVLWANIKMVLRVCLCFTFLFLFSNRFILTGRHWWSVEALKAEMCSVRLQHISFILMSQRCSSGPLHKLQNQTSRERQRAHVSQRRQQDCQLRFFLTGWTESVFGCLSELWPAHWMNVSDSRDRTCTRFHGRWRLTYMLQIGRIKGIFTHVLT